MTTAFTPLLQLALPVTGELDGAWGDVVNNNITSMVEEAVAGLANVTHDDTANYSLTVNNGVSDEARCAILVIGGILTAARNVVCPATTKQYNIKNATTGGFAITIKTSGGTGVTIPNGSTTLVYCNGTNVVSGYDYYTTPITGIIKGNGSTFVQAVANTDYLYPNLGVLTGAFETNTISASAATGTINYDLLTQSVIYVTANATGNWTVNFRASSGTTLNSVMAANQSVTCALISAMGSSAYYNTNVTIDGVSVTPKWQGGTAPVAGVANALNVYTYTIIKTASATYTVLAAQSQFA